MNGVGELIGVPIVAELVRGAAELEATARGLLPHRLPRWVREQFPDPQLLQAEGQPAGVRLAFRTRSTVIALDAVPTKLAYRGASGRPSGMHDLLVDGILVARQPIDAGDRILVDLRTGGVEHRAGEPGTALFAGLDPRDKHVEIWLPWNERTEIVGLRTDAPVRQAPASGRPEWLHYGSSISQGSNADGPTGTWPVVAALRGQVEITNLGFGGSAMLDQFAARVIRDAPADVISLEIGINLVNVDAMRLRAFVPAVHGFLDTIRDGHPGTPLTVLSPIYCGIHEATPGPAAIDSATVGTNQIRFVATGDPLEVSRGALTLEVIRAELERIVAQRSTTDPALTYLDGKDLYGPHDAEQMPLADGLHPGPIAHQHMGRAFAARVLGR
ncbi:MAG: lipase [Pseudonocardiales bacterium]|nr:lipase [Pseudonocardiales bacterium]